ncbi:Uncharacterised protein [uncultured Ruminococcus sp.]|jgi:hypothetical protein|nr:Uncharacterised protein [uncultured Ruminococcus sp.]
MKQNGMIISNLAQVIGLFAIKIDVKELIVFMWHTLSCIYEALAMYGIFIEIC